MTGRERHGAARRRCAAAVGRPRRRDPGPVGVSGGPGDQDDHRPSGQRRRRAARRRLRTCSARRARAWLRAGALPPAAAGPYAGRRAAGARDSGELQPRVPGRPGRVRRPDPRSPRWPSSTCCSPRRRAPPSTATRRADRPAAIFAASDDPLHVCIVSSGASRAVARDYSAPLDNRSTTRESTCPAPSSTRVTAAPGRRAAARSAAGCARRLRARPRSAPGRGRYGSKPGRRLHGVVPVRRPDTVGVARPGRPVQHPVGELDADVVAQPTQVSLGLAQEVGRRRSPATSPPSWSYSSALLHERRCPRRRRRPASARRTRRPRPDRGSAARSSAPGSSRAAAAGSGGGSCASGSRRPSTGAVSSATTAATTSRRRR